MPDPSTLVEGEDDDVVRSLFSSIPFPTQY